MSEEAKRNVCVDFNERLLKVEFEWDPEGLSMRPAYPNHYQHHEEGHLKGDQVVQSNKAHQA